MGDGKAPTMDTGLARLEEEYLRRWFEFQPGYALQAGVHDHDHRLEDLSPESVEAFCVTLDGFRARANALELAAPSDRIERTVLLSRIEGTLQEFRDQRIYRENPYASADALSSQLNLLAIFHFAPAEERLRAAIAKERQVPRFLEGVRRGHVPTAPILVQYGLRGIEGALSLVKKDLPLAFRGVGSQALRAEFDEATRTAAEALERHASWLRKELPAGPERAYALGKDRYAGWLRAAERVTTPLPELERWALEEIEAARRGIQEEAARLKPGARPADVVASITADHPPTGQVVAEARRIADEVYAWVRSKDLVTFPTDARVQIDDTPDFMRWSFGSMWSPGPFETSPDVVATFYATDADPAWPREKQDEHLTAFSYRGLENLAIHEAYPGHFVQNMHQVRVGSLVRRAFWWGVFGEGWAHYAEQMAIEEGFGGDDPKTRAEVHILQLQEALARLCRFVNGLRLHTHPDWDFDRGTGFFVEKAWVAEAVARAECERGAFDPFYLRYTLGKKEILELRDECRKALGARFSLRGFHDALLGCGSGPMESMRALTKIALGI